MKKYVLVLSFLTIMNILSEAVASSAAPFSSQCNAGLKKALKILNKKLKKKITVDNLKNNKSDALTFKKHFIDTKTWDELTSLCSSLPKDEVNCPTCDDAECCEPWHACFWDCTLENCASSGQ